MTNTVNFQLSTELGDVDNQIPRLIKKIGIFVEAKREQIYEFNFDWHNITQIYETQNTT